MTSIEHAHPTINAFNRTGQRFLWSIPSIAGQIALYRWDPPRGYTPVLTLTHDPSYEFRLFLVRAFTKEYPLPCGCAHEDPDATIHFAGGMPPDNDTPTPAPRTRTRTRNPRQYAS